MATQLTQVSGVGDKAQGAPGSSPNYAIRAGVITKFGTFHVPPLNRLANMNHGNPLAPLVNSANRAAMFPHVQTPIGEAGQSRALSVKTPIYPSTNNVY